MSTTYSIGCTRCRKHVWIAQTSCDHKTLYSGMPEVMDALKDFLFAHVGHPLEFNVDCDGPFEESEEIEPQRKPQT